MDFRTISATLAILGTGLAVSACNKTQTDATEVPAAADKKADGHCNSHANGEKGCGGAKGEGGCGGAKGEGGCGGAKGEGGCGGAKGEAPPAAAAAEPTPTASAAAPAAEPTPAATASAPAAATKKKTGDKKKDKTKGGEMACGEGTCG